MSSFLELAQKVAQESGTVSGTQPTTVLAQSGRLRDIVGWVQSAYRAIQVKHEAWLWLQGEFETDLVIGTKAYSGTDLSVTDLSRFLLRDRVVSAYLTATGVSDEAFLLPLDWNTFYDRFMVGSARSVSGKPQYYSVDEAGQIVLYPNPDAATTIHARYRKAPQELTVDASVPNMPVQFHDLIVWHALLFLGGYDESMAQYPIWNMNYRSMMSDLEISQLPNIALGETLA